MVMGIDSLVTGCGDVGEKLVGVSIYVIAVDMMLTQLAHFGPPMNSCKSVPQIPMNAGSTFT